jgi:TRAP-type transport system periplasmic protein
MRRFLLRCAALSLLLPLGVQAEPVQLRFAYVGPGSETTWTSTLKPFIDAVNAESKGTLDIQGYPDGTLGRNSRQQVELILNGIVDIAFVLPGQTPGRFPDDEVMELPGVYRDLKTSSLVFTRLAQSGVLKGYEDYFVIGTVVGVPASIHTRTPVLTLADLKGKKLRAQNSTDALTLRQFGVATVLLPTPETAEAIARGTIDGTALQIQALVDFGVARVTSYDYMADLTGASLTVLMTRQRFESLPKAGQDAIRKFSGEWFAQRFITAIGEENERQLARFKADPKRKVTFPTEQERNELNAVYRSVVDKWAADNPRHAELLAAARAEIAKVDAGK